MKQKLTNEEIARVFAMYLGSDLLTTNYWSAGGFTGSHRDISLRNIEAIVLDMCIYLDDKESKDDDLMNTRKSFIKLKPVSGITEEDSIELAKIILTKSYVEIDKIDEWLVTKQSDSDTEVRYSGAGITGGVNISSDCKVHDERIRPFYYDENEYLILNGYAVPLFFGINHWANGKTAIELGIAISKI